MGKGPFSMCAKHSKVEKRDSKKGFLMIFDRHYLKLKFFSMTYLRKKMLVAIENSTIDKRKIGIKISEIKNNEKKSAATPTGDTSDISFGDTRIGTKV